jgi:hypothetical protein
MKMQELQQSPETPAWMLTILYKFLPAGLGAAIMIAIEPPKTRGELFWRLVAAFICSAIFGELAMDWAHSLSLLSFLDPAKRSHQAAVDFIVGGSGWFVLGGGGVMLRRFRGEPIATVEDAKKVV